MKALKERIKIVGKINKLLKPNKKFSKKIDKYFSKPIIIIK